jgi:nitronate monooxygenase
MAGGLVTPELVAAVSNAGGLGSYPGGYLHPDLIDSAIKKIRSLTNKPFAVNLFIPEKVAEGAAPSPRVVQKLSEMATEVGVAGPGAPAHESFTFEDQLAVVMDNGVPVFSFTFGMPDPAQIEVLRRKGVAVMGTATSVAEARKLEEAGCSAVAAQGIEAGGHRGTFPETPHLPMTGTIALVPQIADNVRIPVVASGGIMDGRGIVAALALGASAVQMGTAFLSAAEASVPEAWLQAIKQSDDTSTVLTRVYTGKYARGIKNRFFEDMAKLEAEVPHYPVQHALTAPIRAAAKAKGDARFMSLWAGQAAPMSRRHPAAELVEILVEESRGALEGLRS